MTIDLDALAKELIPHDCCSFDFHHGHGTFSSVVMDTSRIIVEVFSDGDVVLYASESLLNDDDRLVLGIVLRHTSKDT